MLVPHAHVHDIRGMFNDGGGWGGFGLGGQKFWSKLKFNLRAAGSAPPPP